MGTDGTDMWLALMAGTYGQALKCRNKIAAILKCYAATPILVHPALGISKYQQTSCYTQPELYGLGVTRCQLLAYCGQDTKNLLRSGVPPNRVQQYSLTAKSEVLQPSTEQRVFIWLKQKEKKGGRTNLVHYHLKCIKNRIKSNGPTHKEILSKRFLDSWTGPHGTCQ